MTRTYQTLKGTNERIDEMNARFEEALTTIEAIKTELETVKTAQEDQKARFNGFVIALAGFAGFWLLVMSKIF